MEIILSAQLRAQGCTVPGMFILRFWFQDLSHLNLPITSASRHCNCPEANLGGDGSSAAFALRLEGGHEAGLKADALPMAPSVLRAYQVYYTQMIGGIPSRVGNLEQATRICLRRQ